MERKIPFRGPHFFCIFFQTREEVKFQLGVTAAMFFQRPGAFLTCEQFPRF